MNISLSVPRKFNIYIKSSLSLHLHVCNQSLSFFYLCVYIHTCFRARVHVCIRLYCCMCACLFIFVHFVFAYFAFSLKNNLNRLSAEQKIPLFRVLEDGIQMERCCLRFLNQNILKTGCDLPQQTPCCISNQSNHTGRRFGTNRSLFTLMTPSQCCVPP